MTPDEKRAIEWECQQLALKFFAFNDGRDYEALAALFTEDGEFARPTDPDNPVRGRDAILAAFAGRPAERVTRHLCTNVVVEAESAERARGSMYILLYTGNAADTADLGIHAQPRQMMGEYQDEYRRTAEGWRIARRSGNVTFTIG